MANKEFDKLKNEIHNNGIYIDSTNQLKEILKNNKSVSLTSHAYDYVLDEYFKIKIGSNKLGQDTAIYNVNHGLNCYSDKKGHCNNCNICYAKRDLSTYINSCLYNIASEINFKELGTDKIIKDIEEQITEDIKFMRISEAGDIQDIDTLHKVIKIADYFYHKYGIISYTYTHNIELEKAHNEIQNSSLVLTYSYNTKLENVKKSDVIKKEDLKKYINNDDFVICAEECYHCSYCKDKTDTRTVLFVNHKNKSVKKILSDVLSKEEIRKLEAKKFADYSKFIIKQIQNKEVI